MKSLAWTLVLLAVSLYATAGYTQDGKSGIFVGLAGGFQWVPGTGSWAEYDFEIDQPLSVEEGGPVGLAWSEKFLLGIRPLIGYRINPRLTLQVGYAINISKSSQQTYSEYDFHYTYEQGMNIEWQQRSLEVVGIFHPDPDLGYYFYAGWDLTAIEAKATLYEGVEYEDDWGDIVSEVSADKEADDISATGIILGGGFEFPSENKKSVAFVSAQYSSAQTNDTLFGTEGFKVKVGGLAIMLGIRWNLFR